MTRPVLIVEDDADIAEGLRYNLEREGLAARVAETGEKGLAAALDRKNPPALILLDLMLPGMSGTELCRRLRQESSAPRGPPLIRMARVRAVLRRSEEVAVSFYQDERLQIHLDEMRVMCGGGEVKLTRKEFGLL